MEKESTWVLEVRNKCAAITRTRRTAFERAYSPWRKYSCTAPNERIARKKLAFEAGYGKLPNGSRIVRS